MSRPDGCAIVTGGTRGIGAAISRRLVARGAAVAAGFGSDHDRAAQFAAECALGETPISVHQADWYPRGGGLASEVGSGPGLGSHLNVELPPFQVIRRRGLTKLLRPQVPDTLNDKVGEMVVSLPTVCLSVTPLRT